MRVTLTEQSGEGDGDFSPQYFLEGVGWEVQNPCILEHRPGGQSSQSAGAAPSGAGGTVIAWPRGAQARPGRKSGAQWRTHCGC